MASLSPRPSFSAASRDALIKDGRSLSACTPAVAAASHRAALQANYATVVGSGSGPVSRADSGAGSPGGVGEVRSARSSGKKFLNHWKQAASMSKLGNRTKNLIGRREFDTTVD